MELFNYIRNSGYERDTPFVNDVKYHPVLKAKKTFASGILAAFMSSDAAKNAGDDGNGIEDESGSIVGSIGDAPSTKPTSIFGKLKQVTQKI